MPPAIPLFDLTVGRAEEQAVSRVLRSRWLSQGREVEALERTFARTVSTRSAVACSSCTAALHMSLLALGVGPGDEVITTPLTFMATANAILYTGARPIFADIDPETFCLSPESVEERVTRRTKALLPVHYAGLVAGMKGLREIARDRRLALVEDAAHALGSRAGGRMAGNFGDMACFSFYPNKTLTTGEGGMVTVSNPRLDRRLRLLRSHGMTKSAYQRHGGYTYDYEVETLGYNYRMHEVEAAIGRVQMGRLASILRERERAVRQIRRGLDGLPLRFQRVPSGDRPAFHFLPVFLEEEAPPRDRVLEALHREGVLASFHYPLVYHHRYHRNLFRRPPRCPAAEEAERRLVSLPCHQGLGTRGAQRVVEAVRKALAS